MSVLQKMLGFTFGLGLITLTSIVFGQPKAEYEKLFKESFGECSRGWTFSPFTFEPEMLVFECFPPPAAGEPDRWNRCIPLELRCDGKRQCANGRDERDCGAPESTACPFSYVPCQRGQCVNRRRFTQLFESVDDALSYCDEKNRNYIEHVMRKENQKHMRYRSDNSDGQPASETCDGVWCEPEQYCVDKSSVCDGYNSCSDGSDEDASLCTPDRPCDGMKCVRRWSSNNNTHCISTYEICNNDKDCENGEDEELQFCLSRNCSEPEDFKCPDTGRCVSSYNICDGYDHCRDGSDEAEELCEEKKTKCDLTQMTEKGVYDIRVWDTHRNECQQAHTYCEPDEIKENSDERMLISQRKKEVCAQASCLVPLAAFRCSGGDYGVDYCIPETSVCDGYMDCLGGEDEDAGMCTPDRKCFRGQMACGDGQCVTETQRCDGVVNCVNGFDEDEEMCGKPGECSSQYSTSCGDGQCIWKRSVCDNVTDCLNGRDEQDDFCRSVVCDNLYFECNHPGSFGGKCAPKTTLCTDNFEVFCLDPVDEETCEVRKEVCPDGEVPCGDGQCIKEEYICSWTEVHCKNGNFTSDTFCNSRECAAEQFSCGDGQCISREKVCDGLTDCYRTQKDESFDQCGYPTTTIPTTTPTTQGSVDNVAVSCQDQVTYCHQLSTLRVCERHQTFSREYCAKTCGLCSTQRDENAGSVNYVINHYYNCKP